MLCEICSNTVIMYKTAKLCNNCYKKKYYIKNKDKINTNNMARYHRNKSKINDRVCPCCNHLFTPKRVNNIYCSKKCADKFSRSLRKDEINDYFKKIYHNSTNRRIASCLRSRLNKALKGSYKTKKYSEYIGCTPTELKEHLESKWLPGMSWSNYGLHGWHIDHVIPLSSFDLSKESDLLNACHFTNLQPLWAKDNIKKGNTYEETNR